MKSCNHATHVGTCPACQQHKIATLKAQTAACAAIGKAAHRA